MSSIEITHRHLRSIESKLQSMETTICNAINNRALTSPTVSAETEGKLEILTVKVEDTKNTLTQTINTLQVSVSDAIRRIEALENAVSVGAPFTGEPLYVILPYFNYCSFQKRTTLFIDFIERYKDVENIKIVIVEGVLADQTPQLPDFGAKVFMHIHVTLKDRIWIKENLINLAVKQLPSEWKYMAWIDADITFLNTNWATETVELLQTNQVVQMFHSAVNMGPDGETLKVEQGFIYMYLKSGREFSKSSRYGVWHPGFAWACSREAYDKMGGLLEIGILGSGDRHMALGLIGLAEFSYPGNIGLSYKAKVLALQKNMEGFKIDYLKGSVLHHFHGSIADRRYVDRWAILTKNLYNVNNDVCYNSDNVLSLTEKGKRMQPEMDEYFVGRKEDSTKA